MDQEDIREGIQPVSKSTLPQLLKRIRFHLVTTRTDGREIAQHLWSFITRVIEVLFPLILFLLAFLPRAIYPVARATNWHFRAKEFVQAVSLQDWGATLLAPHPGVTTLWLAGIALWLGGVVIPGLDGSLLHQQMAIELLPLALVVSLAIVLAYFLLSRIFDRTMAVVSILLLALDPLHLCVSKTVHLDALMSVFVMLSALWMLVYIGQGGKNRSRHLVLSGASAGLAWLTKTSSLFLVPYLLLCLGVWKFNELAWPRLGTRLSLPRWRNGLKAAREILQATMIWVLVAAAVFFLLWPSMWVQPKESLGLVYGGITEYTGTPHSVPILFMGETTLEDPGLLFYPVNLALKTTAVTFPCFFLGLAFVFSRGLDRRQRLALLLAIAFVVFFTAQMTLGQKKTAARYNLPAFEFVDIVAGFGAVYTVRWLTRGRRWLFNLGLSLVVAGQFLISIPRHPYYGTHFNLIFGGPKAVLEKGILAGQEQAEGLDIAADYLNGLPLSRLLVVGSQLNGFFKQYFWGKAVPLTDDKVDYLVFARNPVVRGWDASVWQGLWDMYRTRQPKLVVTFDDVPYVWVYKVGPVIDETAFAHSVYADVGHDFRLLGYDLEPTQAQPGETVHLTLYWEAVHKPTGDYTVFTHLLDPTGQMRGQKDNQPQGGMYPTYLWDEGERIQDEYELAIASEASPGTYEMAVGMYYLPTLERLPIIDQNGTLVPDARLLIPGPEVVQPSE